MQKKELNDITNTIVDWQNLFKYLEKISKASVKPPGLEYILKKKDINAKDPIFGLTFLIRAIVSKNLPLVQLILEHTNADVELAVDNITPLGYAVWSRASIEILAALINKGAKVDTLFFDKNENLNVSLLHLTLKLGNGEAFEYLLSRNADPNFCDPEKNVVPLFYCAGSALHHNMKLLFKHGARADVIDFTKVTALHLLFQKKITENTVLCLKELLEHKADLNIRDDIHKETPFACFINKLPSKEDVSENERQKMNEIIKQIIELFLQYGFDPTALCTVKNNSITLSIQKKQYYVLETLLKYEKAESVPDMTNTPLATAIICDNEQAFEILIHAYKSKFSNKPVSNFINEAIKIYNTSPDNAASSDYSKLIAYFTQRLKKQGLEFILQLINCIEEKLFDQSFVDLMTYIWVNNKLEKNELNEIDIWINANLKKYNEIEFIRIIEKMMIYLPIMNNIDTVVVDKNSLRTSLFCQGTAKIPAIRQVIKDAILTAKLIDKTFPSFDINRDFTFSFILNGVKETSIADDLFGPIYDKISTDVQYPAVHLDCITQNALMLAIRDNVKMVEPLLELGADIEIICPETQRNILHYCVEYNRLHTLQYFLDSNAFSKQIILKFLFQGDISGFNPLHIAAYEGYTNIAELLINYIKNNQSALSVEFINSQTTDKATSIFLAAQNGHHKTLKLLLDEKGDPDIPRVDSKTPLFMAVKEVKSEAVSALVEFYKQQGKIPASIEFKFVKVGIFNTLNIINSTPEIERSADNLEIPPPTSIESVSHNANDNFASCFESHTESKLSGFAFLSQHFGREMAKSFCQRRNKNIEKVVTKAEELASIAIISCFNYLLTSTMPEVKIIETGIYKTPNCKFFLDLFNVSLSKISKESLLRFCNMPIFFAAAEADQGMVKLNLKNIPKEKRLVSFMVPQENGLVDCFKGYVSHELKIIHKLERIIVAKVTGENGTYYIGFEYLAHGLHTTSEKSNFFNSQKNITFYSPKTREYKILADQLASLNNANSNNNNNPGI